MILVIKKKLLYLAIIVLVIITCVVIILVSVKTHVKDAYASEKLVPIYCVESGQKKVALTFDAAWGADKTPEIISILEKNNSKATFFLVGFWIDMYPDLVKDIDKHGHLIANHSLNHLHMSKLSSNQINDEILFTSDKIERLVGYRPKYFRAPFGEYNNFLIKQVLANNALMIQWDVDTLDWRGDSAQSIIDRVNTNAKDGSIILCHNNSDHILEALPVIIASLKKNGYSLVRLDEMVLDDGYIIDPNGCQLKSD
ncbi:MAG: polysaccharide deacetylase family protein [Christensenellaceae bacterium]|jgi:peptidoglycan/xylan/chitin deacetylase (PgdA/CDA1 family)|nr:polysaccharide deacetylase family protein [Christensenellaceae bacterium]